jgi:hypothetical protein
VLHRFELENIQVHLELTMLNLFYEDLIFLAIATTFFVVVGWAWGSAKPYDLPQPLPNWFKIWFLTIQIGGGLLPLIGLGWGIWHGYSNVVAVLVSYGLMLGLQILSESLSLRKFRSVVFVMVPYLYLPYRIWQLYEGMLLFDADELIWIRNLLLIEIVLWTANYALDVSQLPRLLRWDIEALSSTNK